MPSGLIEIVASGNNNLYLTSDPQITFFKIVYKKYTNFSMESIELQFNNIAEFGKKLTCNIHPAGDLIYRTYLKIVLPSIHFENYTEDEVDIDNNEFIEKYNNLILYTNYIIKCYRILKPLLDLTFIDFNYLNIIKNKLIKYKNENIINFNGIVETKIINDTDIINNVLNYKESNELLIKNNLSNLVNTQYQNLLNYIQLYYNLKETKITSSKYKNFAWNKFLGNSIFTNMELEIGGQIIENIPNDWYHIKTLACLNNENIPSYNKLIGNVDKLTAFNNKKKDEYTLLIPLIFSFNKFPGLALPLIALQYHSININIQLNKINNCCYLNSWEYIYNNLKIINYDSDKLNFNNDILYDNYDYEIKFNKLEYDNKTGGYNYNFEEINNEILIVRTNNISIDSINTLLEKYGSIKSYTEKSSNGSPDNTLNIKEFTIMMESEVEFAKSILDNNIDVNNNKRLLNSINIKDASLIMEYVYLDNMEREKFAQSRHEYLITEVNKNLYNINNKYNINPELDFQHPIKELIWFSRPIIYINNNIESKYYNFSSNYYVKSDNINPITESQLILNNVKIFPDKINNIFFNYLIPFNNYSNTIPLGINIYTFSLFPDEFQPSGSCNFTTLKSKTINININDNYFNNYFDKTNERSLQLYIYSSSYNILRISNGIANLAYK